MMKVKLHRHGKVVAELDVGADGALCIWSSSTGDMTLSVRDSRRLAGEILKRSVESTVETVRQGVRARARAEVDRLFDWDDDTDDVP